jgi:predicted PurR-regulated permease PerM
MRETAKRAAMATLVSGGIVVAVLAVWELRLVVALLFLAFMLAAAMRPTVDAGARRGIPRAAGISAHYLVLAGLVAGLLWAVVPRAIDQVDEAAAGLPETRSALGEEARDSDGIKHDLLIGLQRRLSDVPSGESLVDPAVEVTKTVFEVAIGIFFVLACAAYWIYERDRAEDLLCSLLPRARRQRVRDTWNLIDAKLGAYVRGQALLIVLVGTTLSVAFWAIGLPYWLLLVALAAGLAVLVVRLLEDYIVIPRVLGDAVGLTPLVVLVAVAACGILFGGFAVILAIPFAAVLATVADVVVRDKDPAEEEVPTVIFPAKEAETG